MAIQISIIISNNNMLHYIITTQNDNCRLLKTNLTK